MPINYVFLCFVYIVFQFAFDMVMDNNIKIQT
jgi:hypothetical protein